MLCYQDQAECISCLFLKTELAQHALDVGKRCIFFTVWFSTPRGKGLLRGGSTEFGTRQPTIVDLQNFLAKDSGNASDVNTTTCKAPAAGPLVALTRNFTKVHRLYLLRHSALCFAVGHQASVLEIFPSRCLATNA